MGYSKNGIDLLTLCETAWGSDDTRVKATFNTAKYWFGGNTRAVNFPNAQFISYASGYLYSREALGGVYKKAGISLQLPLRGYRPGDKFRYSTQTSGNMWINKFTDGEAWISSTRGSRSGTRLCTASENFNAMFACYCGGGGGGGGSSGSASAGGGGGAAYRYLLFMFDSRFVIQFTVGAAGNAGGGNATGGNGGISSLSIGVADNIPVQWHAQGGTGGGSGGSGGNGGAGGNCIYGQFAPTFPPGECVYEVQSKSGGSGGSRHNAGGNSYVNFNNYTPEATQVTYLTGLGGESGGTRGGGGGGSPLGFGGDGGQSGGDGQPGTGLGGGGGGGIYVLFSSRAGGKGAPGYFAIFC